MMRVALPALAVIALGATVAPAPASATASPAAREFPNCTALQRVYPGGVAVSAAAKNRTVRAGVTYAPRVSAALYRANAKSDRDRDGVACER